jgi:DNA-binding phage protein
MADRKISAVARSTGLHYNVVYRAITDKACNPSYETVKALSDYLEGSAA